MAADTTTPAAGREELSEAERPWIDGEPPKPWREEWFIAETTYGDRVVLRALPEEYTYDYRTADDTYIKADKIKRWMQFPDSQYIAAALSASSTDAAGGWVDITLVEAREEWMRLCAERAHLHETRIDRVANAIECCNAIARRRMAARPADHIGDATAKVPAEAPPAVEGLTGGIYIASKTRHAPKWIALRAGGAPITATWIDEAGAGDTLDFSDLWRRCVSEASSGAALILYHEDGDVLRGALVEAGAALASGRLVFLVSPVASGDTGPLGSFMAHRLVTRFSTVDQAIAAARAANTPGKVATPAEGLTAEDLRQGLSVGDYVREYEWRGDNGDYSPTSRERELIEDAINGFVAALSAPPADAALRKLVMEWREHAVSRASRDARVVWGHVATALEAALTPSAPRSPADGAPAKHGQSHTYTYDVEGRAASVDGVPCYVLAEHGAPWKALRWFVDQQDSIQSRFELDGPKDMVIAMRAAFAAARAALSADARK